MITDTLASAIALTATDYAAVAVCFGHDLKTVSNSNVTILRYEDGGGTNQMGFGIRVRSSDNGLRWFTDSDVTGGSRQVNGEVEVFRGRWYWVEMLLNPDAAGQGSLEMRVTEEATARTGAIINVDIGLSNTTGGIDNVFMGVMDGNASTNGTILLDNFVYDIDDTVLASDIPWHSQTNRVVTKDIHAFVGPGTIENASMQSGGTTEDAVCTIYDTNTAETDPSLIRVELKNTGLLETVDLATAPVRFQRGAYVVISGTEQPRVNIACSPRYASRANVLSHGLQGDH
jgi:hypothetical protein